MADECEIKIFSGSSGETFAQRISDYLEVEPGLSSVITFPEGNLLVRIEETVRDKDVFLVQSIALNPNREFTEILFWIDAFKRASANSVTLVMPYFSYAQGDKKDEPRVSIRGRVCAESIELAGVDRVVTMDLHSPQIQGFFKKPSDHLYALPILCEYFQEKIDLSDTVVVSPDAGFAREARKYASYLDLPVALGDKRRKNHNEDAEMMEIIGEVRGKNALIFDDFSISGGTLVNLARELKARGARDIYAGLSHMLMNERAVKRLENSPIKTIVGTDSVDNDAVKDTEKIKLVSVAPLFAETIWRIHERKSVSILFNQVPKEVFDKSKLED